MMLASRQQIVLFWGPEYVALYNDAYYPAIGAKHPAALGQPLREHWGELLHVLVPLLDGVVESGESFWAHDYPFPLQRHGFLERTYFDISYDPVPLEDGQIGGVMCLVTDTTARVLSQRRLRTLSDLGRATLGLREVARVVDAVVGVIAGNPDDVPVASVYLADSESLSLRAAGGTIIDSPGGSVGEILREVLRAGESREVSDPWGSAGPGQPATALALPLNSGTAIEGVLLAGVNPMFELPGPYREFYELLATNVAAAVTGALAHERERSRVEALAALDRAKTEFFSNVSHEFRTPLTLITGPVTALREDPVIRRQPRVAAELDLVARNGMRLAKLVNTLLEFSRLQAGRAGARFAPTDLTALTRELAAVFEAAMRRAGLSYRAEIAALPEPVWVDRASWEKIVLNLLSNALKFTFRGSIVVTLRCADDERAVVLSVVDSGAGIPSSELPRLFERFHQVPGTHGRSAEGSGIGLALVRELVELHGGDIRVDSTLDRGTTFTVRLPLGSDHLTPELLAPAGETPDEVGVDTADPFVTEAIRWLADDTRRDPQLPDPGTASGRRAEPRAESIDPQQTRVLVVDDNADMREYLTRLLRTEYDVRTAANGAEALEAVRTDAPELIITDVMMPVLDGFGLLAAVRADPALAGIPIVVVSARAGEESAVEGLDAGADDYLVKPFTAGELLARARANVTLARLRRRESAWRTALLNALSDGLFVLDSEGTVVEVNEAFGDILGFGPEGLPYRLPHPWWPDTDSDPDGPQRVHRDMTEALATGHGRWRHRLRHRDGHPVHVETSTDLLTHLVTGQNSAEPEARLVGIVRDVSEEHRAARRAETLHHVSGLLASASTVAAAAGVLATASREALDAQAAVVYIAASGDAVHLDLEHQLGFTAAAPPSPRIRLSEQLITCRAVRTGTPVWLTDSAAAHTDHEYDDPLLAPPARAAAALPLRIGDRRIGAIGLTFAAPRQFPDEERRFATTLAAQAAQAFDRAALTDEHSRIAHTLQRSLLPARVPELPGLAIATSYHPAGQHAQAGGDWYDIIALDEDEVAIAVGDVVGSGTAAAAVMGQLRSALAAALMDTHSPARALGLLSRFTTRIDGAAGSTALCVVVNPRTGLLRCSTAGHPPPVLLDPHHSGEPARFLRGGHGCVLGHRTPPTYTEATARVSAGCTLLLYTDGLIERRGEHLDDSFTRLIDTLSPHAAAHPAELLTSAEVALIPPSGPADDVAIVAARVLPGPFREQLPAYPAQLAGIRRRSTQWATTVGLHPRQIVDLQLALGEALANTIEHAYPTDSPGTLAYRIEHLGGGALDVEVTDHGRWRPEPADNGHRGRGLSMIRALSTELTIDGTPHGTTVKFRTRPAAAEKTIPAPAPLEPATGDTEGLLTVRLTDCLDLAGAKHAHDDLWRRVDGHRGPVRIDLTGVPYLGSAGIRMLSDIAKREPDRIELHAAPGSPAERVLSLADLR
jgi:PAS domain S-box-containing protein